VREAAYFTSGPSSEVNRSRATVAEGETTEFVIRVLAKIVLTYASDQIQNKTAVAPCQQSVSEIS
jgi:hypothetical protein